VRLSKDEKFIAIKQELQGRPEILFAYLFGSFLEEQSFHDIDVVVLNTAPDHLVHEISKGRLVVDRDEDFRTDFIVASWKRYFDIQPKRLQALRDILS
jgi:predicted nucleotidyltransferase